MKLVGMMGSPYVRRVAVSMRLMGLEHEHRQISVFRDTDEFRTINSVVKAPTLICENGEMIMDSSMILDYLEAQVAPNRSLMPKDSAEHQKVLSLIGLGLAVCEKAVQLEYEYNKPVAFHYGALANARHRAIACRVGASGKGCSHRQSLACNGAVVSGRCNRGRRLALHPVQGLPPGRGPELHSACRLR